MYRFDIVMILQIVPIANQAQCTWIHTETCSAWMPNKTKAAKQSAVQLADCTHSVQHEVCYSQATVNTSTKQTNTIHQTMYIVEFGCKQHGS